MVDLLLLYIGLMTQMAGGLLLVFKHPKGTPPPQVPLFLFAQVDVTWSPTKKDPKKELRFGGFPCSASWKIGLART